MAVRAGHGCGRDLAGGPADQDRRAGGAAGQGDVGVWIVPGPGQAAGAPQGDDGVDVGIDYGFDIEA